MGVSQIGMWWGDERECVCVCMINEEDTIIKKQKVLMSELQQERERIMAAIYRENTNLDDCKKNTINIYSSPRNKWPAEIHLCFC